jgi:hypothetical protein
MRHLYIERTERSLAGQAARNHDLAAGAAEGREAANTRRWTDTRSSVAWRPYSIKEELRKELGKRAPGGIVPNVACMAGAINGLGQGVPWKHP